MPESAATSYHLDQGVTTQHLDSFKLHSCANWAAPFALPNSPKAFPKGTVQHGTVCPRAKACCSNTSQEHVDKLCSNQTAVVVMLQNHNRHVHHSLLSLAASAVNPCSEQIRRLSTSKLQGRPSLQGSMLECQSYYRGKLATDLARHGESGLP